MPAPAPAVKVGVCPPIAQAPKPVADPVDCKHCPLIPNDPPSWIPVVKLAVPNAGIPENVGLPLSVGLPANVPVSVPPPDRVVAPVTPSVPDTVSFPPIVALLFTARLAPTIRLLDRVAAPVTPRVPDTVSFPFTVSPLIVVAFSVLGIMLAVIRQKLGTAGDEVQLPNTV